MSSLTLGYIALQQVHGICISKCRLQPVKQVANDGQRIRWPRAAPCWHRWCGSCASRNVITSSVASMVASNACLCTQLWLRLAAWYRVHVAYFMRRPSASATLVLSHSRGGESHLTRLYSQCWCLSAGAVVQLVWVTSVWPALLLMRLLSTDAHSLNQMPTCGCPLSLKPPSPLSTFFRIRPDPTLPPQCGHPLWMTPMQNR